MAVPVDDTVVGAGKQRGIETEQVTTAARADRQLPPTAAYVRDLGGANYTADVAFQQLLGAPQTVATPTREGTIMVPGRSYQVPATDFFSQLGAALECLFPLPQNCPPPTKTVTLPPTITRGPVPVPGPASLVTSVNANLMLTSSQLIARKGGTLLMATGSGHMVLSGSLPSASGIPVALNAKTETVVSDMTYSSRLVSPWPHPTSPDRDLAVKLAGILALLVVVTATVALAASGYRHLVSAR
jgi:hypothetical protein